MRKLWRCFYVKEKFIDQLETNMTDVDPSVVGQHVQPLENNYFKACKVWLLPLEATFNLKT